MPESTDRYYQTQDAATPLFPDALLPPERANLRGKLLIIGGSSAGFSGVNYAYSQAHALQPAAVKVLLPRVLEILLPKNPDFVFAGEANDLGLTQKASPELEELAAWAEAILVIGDLGKNAATAQTLGRFLQTNHQQKPLLVTRDAIDLLIEQLPLEQAPAKLLLTFNQLQKLFKAVLYPKIITFSTPLPQLAEILHKFTTTYQCGLATFANGQFLAAQDGKVIATDLVATKYNPLSLWAGEVAVRALLLSLWSPQPRLAGLAESIL